MLARWERFARLRGYGRIELSTNAGGHALRSIVVGRKAWLFARSTGAASVRPPSTPHHHR
jgi:transposase